MAKRQSLGKGLNALMPNVPRETGTRPATRPGAKKAPGSAPARKAPPTNTAPAKKSTPTKRPAIPAAVAATAPGAAMQVAGLTLLEVPVSKISANPNQPRKIFDEEALQEWYRKADEGMRYGGCGREKPIGRVFHQAEGGCRRDRRPPGTDRQRL